MYSEIKGLIHPVSHLRLVLGDPSKNPPESMTEDPYKTVFVARLPYDLEEAKLRREFERFGPIRMVRGRRGEHLCGSVSTSAQQIISSAMFIDQND